MRMANFAQLAWRCRRGTRELDLLLRGFLDSQYSLLERSEQLLFESLLDYQDPELIDMFWGQTNPKDKYTSLIARIREHATNQSASKK